MLMQDTIHIWSHYIEDFNDAYYLQHLNKLDADFIKKIEAYKFIKDRVKKTVGRLLLQKLFEQSGRKGFISGELQMGIHNKPFIHDWYAFNLSYSEQLVVLAFHTSGSIGIDVEYRKEFDYKSMMSVFHPNEWIRMAAQAQPLDEFYNIWVKKEAVLKAQGTGLVDELFQIDCSGNINHSFKAPWHLKKIDIKEDYVCYLASGFSDAKINLIQFTQSDFNS